MQPTRKEDAEVSKPKKEDPTEDTGDQNEVRRLAFGARLPVCF